MHETDDAALVQQCLNGNKRAFETLVDRYQRVIYNAAYRMVGNYDDAKDIAQTTFVKAYEKLETFDLNGKFFSWIYRIMTNETIDFLNYLRRHTGVDEALASKEAGPDENYRQKEMNDKLQDEMMCLSIDSRMVIVLRHFAELSHEEIGYILNIPAKTVKSRLFTARERLKERFMQSGIRESM